MTIHDSTKIAIFDGARIRKVLFNGEWHFSIVDVCGHLMDNSDPGAYWRKLKQRLTEEGSEVVTFCHGLKLTASDAKSGGAVAGRTRQNIERQTGKKVISKENFLPNNKQLGDQS